MRAVGSKIWQMQIGNPTVELPPTLGGVTCDPPDEIWFRQVRVWPVTRFYFFSAGPPNFLSQPRILNGLAEVFVGSGSSEFRTHKMVSSPSLTGWDTCDISAGNSTL